MLEVHEVANLLPMMTEEEYKLLKADIATHSQREPILVHKGKIIDGRNRARACKELGIEPITREWDGSGSLVQLVLSLNVHRRHLDSAQRAAIAVEVLPLLEKEAKERQRAGGGDKRSTGQGPERQSSDPALRDRNAGKATEQAAQLMGTNRDYVATCKALPPEKLEEVKAGTLSMSEAKKQARPRVSKAEAKKRRDNQRKKCLRGMDSETKRILGEHKIASSAGQMKMMARLQPAGRRLVARLIVEGRASTVEDAKDLIVNDAGRRAEADSQESDEPPVVLPIAPASPGTVETVAA